MYILVYLFVVEVQPNKAQSFDFFFWPNWSGKPSSKGHPWVPASILSFNCSQHDDLSSAHLQEAWAAFDLPVGGSHSSPTSFQCQLHPCKGFSACTVIPAMVQRLFFSTIKQRKYEYARTPRWKQFYVFLATASTSVLTAGTAGLLWKANLWERCCTFMEKTKALHHCRNYCTWSSPLWPIMQCTAVISLSGVLYNYTVKHKSPPRLQYQQRWNTTEQENSVQRCTDCTVCTHPPYDDENDFLLVKKGI